MKGLLAGLAIVAVGSSQAPACVMAPPATPEVQRQRTLDFQASLWDRSQTVFVARVERRGPVKIKGAHEGQEAVLRPVLQLKGPPVTPLVTVRHTHFTSCGPAPFLDALHPQAEGVFVVYSSSAEPTGEAVIGTLAPKALIEPRALEAWAKAYARAAPR
ncbi:hypothetical protein [Caulobacter endophyticus]|uniref:hypothetical protein n=1 Tax=Caulobacter endophyticus TaxID=2172652 RepID=UPI00240F2690|nr:hypothetical protein [Caulobacter endophyticus]MDG2531302.1 hypothetical protein [Caulobacter endophyticus]